MNDSESRILIVAGYGGHSGYAFAVVHELFSLGFRRNVILVAEGYEFLIDKFRPYGEVITQVLPRRPAEPLYKGLMRWFKALIQSTKLTSRYRIYSVFAGGSNFSILPSLLSKFLGGSKIFTIEAIEHFKSQSRAVKVLEAIGGTVFLHWEEQLELYPNGIVVGPVYEPPIYEVRDEGYVLVTTGTLGYKELFDSVEKLGFENVVLQSGDVDPNPYISRKPSWKVFRYTSDIHRWIANASLVITQQGVTASIARLAYRKPTIIVWNPRVTLGAKKDEVMTYAEKLEIPLVDDLTTAKLKYAINNVNPITKEYPNGSKKIASMIAHSIG
ncbi:MAG: polysaccharide biosynthesis protein [Sulfolobales archaeon]|nr:polysaccharide biosynthesis protein [Sulfolobales archaeon]MCX8186065.1 polysaccharide biosynthesis protein [Sulfolobales archaeon]MDW7969360.1 polysaccharide biosynthesis protein [Sulfolobales archaeon]